MWSTNDNREIVQLWWAADEYFKLAKTAKADDELSDKDLQTTVKQLGENCSHLSNIRGTNERLMRLNAHLGSCAIRLYSIDEKNWHKSRGPGRWQDYENLKAKKDSLTVEDVLPKKKRVVHFLLRHNVAHEEDAMSNSKYKEAFDIMQEALQGLTIKELYENMCLVMKEMAKEIKPIIATR